MMARHGCANARMPQKHTHVHAKYPAAAVRTRACTRVSVCVFMPGAHCKATTHFCTTALTLDVISYIHRISKKVEAFLAA